MTGQVLTPKAWKARVAQQFTILPGNEARLPITLDHRPTTQAYQLLPKLLRNSVNVAYSLGSSQATCHYAQVLNSGDSPVVLYAGSVLGRIEPVLVSTVSSVNTTHVADDGDVLPGEDDFPIHKIKVSGDLTTEQLGEINSLLQRNRHAFGYGDRLLGSTTLAELPIDTGDAPPTSYPPRRVSPRGRQLIDQNITELLDLGVIEPSNSPWASPVLLVRQKEKDRFCVDYRRVNDVTTGDQYPLPVIDDILSQFQGKRWFSTFDANKSFHQIPIAESDKPKTAFRTHRGLHQYKRLPFGLKNGPAFFQRFMDRVLGNYKWQNATTYATSTPSLVWCAPPASLSVSLRAMSPSKASRLGHSISHMGIGTLEANVAAVKTFPRPTTVKAVERWLGLCGYYRKFIPDFSTIAAPLNALKTSAWVWDHDCEVAFERLRSSLISAPILAHPDYSKPFILATDASRIGLGAVLSQLDDQQREHPIVYLSRTLTPAEKNYAATELECLGIVWAIKKLIPYLEGSKFTVVTDHSALQWLFDFKGTNRRILGWSVELQPFREDMTIRHRQGRLHSNVDSLSRDPMPSVLTINHYTDDVPPSRLDPLYVLCFCHDPSPVFVTSTLDPPATVSVQRFKDDIIRAYQGSSFGILKQNLEGNPDHPLHDNYSIVDGLLYLKDIILHDLHDSPTAGHLGVNKTVDSVSRRYFWPSMSRDIQAYVRSCQACQRNKSSNQGPTGLLRPLPIPPHRWHTVTMDFAGPFPASGSQRHDMVMVVVDKLTKRSHFASYSQKATAVGIAHLFFDTVVRLHGLPEVIISDRDAKFTSAFWQAIHSRFGTQLAMSSAYHPQTDGQSERMVRVLKEMLRSVVNYQATNWSEHLGTIEIAYNSAKQKSTNMTPFMLDLGYDPRSPHDALSSSPSKVPHAEGFIEHMRQLITAAQDALFGAQASQSMTHNKGRKPSTHQVGDLVMVSTKYLRPPFFKSAPAVSLRPKWVGPFEIMERVGRNAYRLDFPAHIQAHSVVNTSYLKPFADESATWPGREHSVPPPIDELTSEYEIDGLRAHRQSAGRKDEYLVHWHGYPDHEDTC
ncbi:hypothetical protein B9479_007044 [Cryptococcus floricola]|uniref:Integrase catalytic domain-containing protein n=1 Tax=Cryptococcus floricola TaxID=2591691 RepID=A0A5D3AQK9_9TREE|nr:hypothetical protein B9479_007044 [Cryptococcus floricola]